MTNQQNELSETLREMLLELNQEETNQLEDIIVNECGDDLIDEDGNLPNLFRMMLNSIPLNTKEL